MSTTSSRHDTSPGDESAVATFLVELQRAVCPGGGAPPMLLQEARDHLEDAVCAHRAVGRSEGQAQLLALRDFGEVAELAPGYRVALRHRLLWRAAICMLAILAGNLVAWQLVSDPAETSGTFAVVRLAVHAVSWASFLVVAAAMALAGLLDCTGRDDAPAWTAIDRVVVPAAGLLALLAGALNALSPHPVGVTMTAALLLLPLAATAATVWRSRRYLDR